MEYMLSKCYRCRIPGSLHWSSPWANGKDARVHPFQNQLPSPAAVSGQREDIAKQQKKKSQSLFRMPGPLALPRIPSLSLPLSGLSFPTCIIGGQSSRRFHLPLPFCNFKTVSCSCPFSPGMLLFTPDDIHPLPQPVINLHWGLDPKREKKINTGKKERGLSLK